MTLKGLKDFCLNLSGVTEEFPFDDVTLTFKVKGKMFVLVNIETFTYINLKCDPNDAIAFREMFEGVTPGYHMSKKHWNSVTTDGSIEDKIILRWILDSYELVVSKLPKAMRESLIT